MKIMQRIALVGILAAGTLGLAGTAQARDDVYWSLGMGAPGVAVGVGNVPPVLYAPAPVYLAPQPVYVRPRPVYVAPPPYYAEPPVMYGPPPGYWGWRGRRWHHGDRRWEHRRDHDDD